VAQQFSLSDRNCATFSSQSLPSRHPQHREEFLLEKDSPDEECQSFLEFGELVCLPTICVILVTARGGFETVGL
jgi:hypothetical protein